MKSSFPSPNNYSQQSLFNDVHLWVILAFRNKCLSPWRTLQTRQDRISRNTWPDMNQQFSFNFVLHFLNRFLYSFGEVIHTHNPHTKIYMRNRCRIQISNPQVALLYLRWVNCESSLLFYFFAHYKTSHWNQTENDNKSLNKVCI